MGVLGDLGQGALSLAPYAAAGLASGKARGAQAGQEYQLKQLELALRQAALDMEATQLEETSRYHKDTIALGREENASRERYQNREKTDAERLLNKRTVFDPDFGAYPRSAQEDALREYGDKHGGNVPYGTYIPPGSGTRYDAPNESGLQNLLSEVLQGLTGPGAALDRVGAFKGPRTVVPPTAAEEAEARARGEQARVDLTGVNIPISEATRALIESRNALAAYNRAKPEDLARDDRARDAAFLFAKDRFGKEFSLAKNKAQQEFILGKRRNEIAALQNVLDLRRLEMQAPLTRAQVAKLEQETRRAATAFDPGTWQRVESLREAGFKMIRTISGKTKLDPATEPLRQEYYRLIGLFKDAAEENVRNGGTPPPQPTYPGLSYPMAPSDPLGGGYPLGDLGSGATGRGTPTLPPHAPPVTYGPQPGAPLASVGEFLKKPVVKPVGPGGIFGPGRAAPPPAGGLDGRGNVNLTLTPEAYARVVSVLQGGKAGAAKAPRGGGSPGRTPPALPPARPRAGARPAPPRAPSRNTGDDDAAVEHQLAMPGSGPGTSLFDDLMSRYDPAGSTYRRLAAAYKRKTGKTYARRVKK